MSLDSIARLAASRVLRIGNVIERALKRKPPATPPESILVVKLDAIGDVILCTPFLRSLRKSFPQAEITLVVSALTFPAIGNCPWVRVVAFRDPPPGCGHARRLFDALMFAREISEGKGFDLAVAPRWDIDFYNTRAILCACGARRIVAYSTTLNSAPRNFFTRLEQRGVVCVSPESAATHHDRETHEVERNLALIPACGGTIDPDDHTELWPIITDHVRAATLLPKQRPIFAFGIGAGHPRRCWPEQRFAELATRIIEETGGSVVLIGDGEADAKRAKEIARLAPDVASLVSKMTLLETAALLSKCDLFIGNDSGPLHIASAMKTPVVDIFGLPMGAKSPFFSAERFGPWRTSSIVVRPDANETVTGPATHPTDVLRIDAISVEDVERAVRTLLQKSQAVARA